MNNLNAVPVLAEPRASCDGNQHGQTQTGGAREGNVVGDSMPLGKPRVVRDSRGGVHFFCVIFNRMEKTESIRRVGLGQNFLGNKLRVGQI